MAQSDNSRPRIRLRHGPDSLPALATSKDSRTRLREFGELSCASINVLADDSQELTFPENWKIPKHVTDRLAQQKRVRIQKRIDNLRKDLSDEGSEVDAKLR